MIDNAGQPSADDRIIETTLTLIARVGIGAVSMSAIAKTAGVARQTLYNHYPDIDSIVTAAIARHNRESIRQLESSIAVVDSPTAKLTQLARHFVAVGAHAGHSGGIEHGLSAEARATLREYDETVDEHLRAILTDGLRRGVFRADLTIDVDAVLVRHVLKGLSEQAANAPDRAAEIAASGARTLLAATTNTPDGQG